MRIIKSELGDQAGDVLRKLELDDYIDNVGRKADEVVDTNNIDFITSPSGVAVPRYIADQWHRGTFDNVVDSMEYHLGKHGKGRTLQQYTIDAMNFYRQNKHRGTPVTLKDGTLGIRIQTGSGRSKVGGYWTVEGKLVTFWD